MHQRIAEFSTLVDRTGRLRCGMARNAAGEGKLLEEPLHPLDRLRHVRIDLAVSPFQVAIGDHARTAMAWTADIYDIHVTRLNDAVQVGVDEIQAGRRAPMAEQARLDVFGLERLMQEWIVHQIDLADRKVVCGAPVAVDQRKLFVGNSGPCRVHEIS